MGWPFAVVWITVSPLSRAAIGLLYPVPAATAGYNGTLGFAHMGIRSEAWRVTFAVVGAIAVGGTAWARMALFVPPEEGRRIAGNPATHRLAGAATQGCETAEEGPRSIGY
jgi:hypothetical protein